MSEHTISLIPARKLRQATADEMTTLAAKLIELAAQRLREERQKE